MLGTMVADGDVWDYHEDPQGPHHPEWEVRHTQLTAGQGGSAVIGNSKVGWESSESDTFKEEEFLIER